MNPEQSPKPGWLRIGVENEISIEKIDNLVQKVAEYKLEGVIYSPGDYTEMGTIIEASMKAIRFRDLKPREELSPEEQIIRDEIEELYHEFEFDEI
jgi:hypothetical protein